MDKIKEKLAKLRVEADDAIARADEAESKNKKYAQELLEKDQEIQSLTHRLGVVSADLEDTEGKLAGLKSAQEDNEATRTNSEGLSRKIQLLEEELDSAEKNVKETVEKLRQVDVKAEHFERQVLRAEQERDQWEKKYEMECAKSASAKAELDELLHSMQDL